MNPRILFIDIETSPNVVHTWGLFNQNVGLSQIIQPSRMLCFAAKFLDDDAVTFSRDVTKAHKLMSQADYIVHYNGDKFDIPILNGEFLLGGMTPTAPAKHLDLYKVYKKHFRFPSGKLQYITQALGLEGKIQHEGHTLWVGCMAGDKESWKRMKEYNIQDVLLLESLFEILTPWLPNSYNLNLFKEENELEGCPKCRSLRLVKEGFRYTSLGKYQQWSCKDCGGWSSSRSRLQGVDLR